MARLLKKQRLTAMDGKHHDKPIDRRKKRNRRPRVVLEQACKGCGCTQSNACMTEDGPCYWAKPDLCSGCA